jgi:CBS domain-containing protein
MAIHGGGTPMSKARDVMHLGAECVGQDGTLAQAAQMMRDMHVGALPICGSDNRLRGIITDRDIVVRCIAAGHDPNTMTCGQLARGTPIWVDVEAETDDVLDLMIESGVRRVPVLEERRLVGMISEADLAQRLDQRRLAHFAEAIYSSPPNS